MFQSSEYKRVLMMVLDKKQEKIVLTPGQDLDGVT